MRDWRGGSGERQRIPGDGPPAEQLLRRIGLDRGSGRGCGGLRTVHRAFVASVPTRTSPSSSASPSRSTRDGLCERILAGGRGGYCFEVNTVLRTLLESLGFEVERRQGIVGPRDAHPTVSRRTTWRSSRPRRKAERFIVEAGRGDGSLDPLPLEPRGRRPGARSPGRSSATATAGGSCPARVRLDPRLPLRRRAGHPRRLRAAPRAVSRPRPTPASSARWSSSSRTRTASSRCARGPSPTFGPGSTRRRCSPDADALRRGAAGALRHRSRGARAERMARLWRTPSLSTSDYHRRSGRAEAVGVTALLVGVAGMAGVLSRYGISSMFHGSSLPWATVGINVAGSLLLGMLVSSHRLQHGRADDHRRRLPRRVHDVLDLHRPGGARRRRRASPDGRFLYLCASLVLGLLAAAAGFLVGRELL